LLPACLLLQVVDVATDAAKEKFNKVSSWQQHSQQQHNQQRNW
jgi:hypothetical protein